MLEGLFGLFHPRGVAELLRDVVDVSIVAYAIYRLLLILRGTRALQVGQGLGFVVVVYLAAQRLGLVTVYSLLDRLLASFLLLVVVIFQGDIRRTLMRVGNRSFLWRWRKVEESGAVEEAIQAAGLLAQRKLGAIIVFEREAALDDFASHGVVLDAACTRELLYAVFISAQQNPLHDGAVVIRNARIWKAGALLPLTNNPALERSLGTRHRAAIGVSEETDAVVIIVSEERGEVSMCFNGNIVRGLDTQSLRQALYGLFYARKAAAYLRDTQEAESRRAGRASLPPPERPPPSEN
ncbi:MAG: TIGR00159 family protein [Deltaproteobacteria bacterium]|nr:TIGR00159 family protein [Deltaproteobacteria bacterium]